MEETKDLSNSQIPTAKVYSDKEIGVGTFIGGPLVAGYFIAQNFKEFGESGKAKITWVITIIMSIVIFSMAFFFERLPSQLLPLIYISATYLIVRIYQGKQMNAHISKDGQIHSWVRTLAISILTLIVTFLVFIGLVFATLPSEKTKTFEDTKIEITYIEDNLTKTEVNSMANALKDLGYYNESSKSYFYLDKINNNYEISMTFENAASIDTELINEVTQLKADLDKLFPKNKIIININANDSFSAIKRVE